MVSTGKKVGVLFLGLLVMSLFFVGVVSASNGWVNFGKNFGEFFTGFAEDPANPAAFSDTIAYVAKWLILFLVVLLIYSGMEMADFPPGKKNNALRFIIATIMGLLITVMITQQELLTMMQSYKAAGIAISILIPMIALGFVTFAVAISLNGFGIVLQRIAWGIFSVFLFIRTALAVFVKLRIESESLSWITGLRDFVLKHVTQETKDALQGLDGSITLILLVVSILVFWFMVIKNDQIISWIAGSKRTADLERYADTQERASAKNKMDAEQTKN
jgi:hypothetical protein